MRHARSRDSSERLITCRTLNMGFYASVDPLIGWPTKDGKSRAETRAVIGYRLSWAPSASIKATANGEMSDCQFLVQQPEETDVAGLD